MAASWSTPRGIGSGVRRFGTSAVRLSLGVLVLWILWRQLGSAPFKAGVRAVSWQAVAVAGALTAVTTVCSAWRWQLVARAIGVDLDLAGAVSAYYRSLFLNSVLFGGVVGDVHRAVRHGRRSGDVPRGLRAVVWERLCGQVVQVSATAVVLLIVPSPVRPVLTYLLAGLVGVAGCAAVIGRASMAGGRSWLANGARVFSADLRAGLLATFVWPRLVLASVLVVAGHTATFVVAARVAGSTAPTGELLALLLVVQSAMVLPVSIGGWGVREGAAAWAFAVAGFGAATGVTVATLYAVLMLAAVSPGAGLLLADAVRGMRGDAAGQAARTMAEPSAPPGRPRSNWRESESEAAR